MDRHSIEWSVVEWYTIASNGVYRMESHIIQWGVIEWEAIEWNAITIQWDAIV